MLAVDTNVLVRLITRDDPKQLGAAEAAVAKGAWVSHLVLAETVWVLTAAYELSREQIVTAVEMLVDHQHLTMQDADVVVSALEQYREHGAVGLSDCLVLEIAAKAGHTPLATFDRALSRVAGTQRL